MNPERFWDAVTDSRNPEQLKARIQKVIDNRTIQTHFPDSDPDVQESVTPLAFLRELAESELIDPANEDNS